MLALVLAACLCIPPVAGGSVLFQPDTPIAPRLPAGLVDLRPKFKTGQKTRLRMTMESKGTAPNLSGLDIDHILDGPDAPAPPGPGKKPAPSKPSPTKPGGQPKEPAEPELKSRQEFVLVFVVKDGQEGNDSIVDVTFESMKASSESRDYKEEYDSTKPEPAGRSNLDPRLPASYDDPLLAAMKPLVGSTITLTVDPNGNIKDAKGGSEWSSLAGLVGGGSPGELFRGILSPSSSPGLVRVGQAWETRDRVKTGVMGEFNMTTQSRLTSHAGALAHVDFKGAITPGSEGGPGDGTFQIKESTYQGRYAWDTERGFLKSMSSEQRIRLDAGMLGTVQHQQSVRVERIGE
jgi:hypothetical protein